MKIKSNNAWSLIDAGMLQNDAFVHALKKDIIKSNSNGQFFTATFTKKDGTERRMNGRIGVTKYLKGGGKGYEYNHLLTVWDSGVKEYRTVNLRTLKRIRMNGKTVEFR